MTGTMNYKPKGFRVKPRSRASIRQDAQIVSDVLRNRLGVRGPKFPIVEALEFMVFHELLELEIKESSQLKGIAAQLTTALQSIPTLQVSEEVYDAACDDENFGRFTIAHELGHYFLHSQQGIALQRVQLDAQKAHKPFEDSEWQANTFAGELLVDNRLITSYKSIFKVSEDFGVCLKTAKIQWKEK